MSATLSSSQESSEVYEVDTDDLPVSCPGPRTPVWNLHPKVYLDVATTGSAQCPYCGAEYRLSPDAQVHGH